MIYLQRIGLTFLFVLAVIVVVGYKLSSKTAFGAIVPTQSTGYNAIGTVASPVTLDTAFNNNSSTMLLSRSLSHVVFAGTYTPKTTNAKMYVRLERSLDGGTTFYPYSTLQVTPTETLVYSDSFATSTSSASPFTIPGDGTSTSGTAIGFSWDMEVAADYLRVSLAEHNGTSTPGTAYLRTRLQSD